LTSFLDVVEGRPGVVLRDPLLALVSPVNLTWLTFALIYAGLIAGVIFLLRHPRALLTTIESYVLLVLVRMVMMIFVPLDPPPGLIPLADPLVQFVGSGGVPTRDLFFSGHASTLFLLSLTARGRLLKALFLCCAAAVAVAVLWQHVHYTIDVIVAPFAAYACYRLILLRDGREDRLRVQGNAPARLAAKPGIPHPPVQ
jgi:membrane-associated phospholipid phosphatase